VPTFPKARYLIGQHEYDFWKSYDDEEQQAMLGDSIKPIFDASLVQLVDLDHVISPEIATVQCSDSRCERGVPHSYRCARYSLS
jgi:hypothetical protein